MGMLSTRARAHTANTPLATTWLVHLADKPHGTREEWRTSISERELELRSARLWWSGNWQLGRRISSARDHGGKSILSCYSHQSLIDLRAEDFNV